MQAIKFVNFFRALAFVCALFFLCACGEKSPAEIEQINKKKSELAVRRAQVMSAEGKNKDAIAMLENAYRECGARVEICEALANAFIADGQTASAGIFYEQAYNCDNSRSDLLIFAANAFEQTDSFEAALGAYEKFLKKNKNDTFVIKSIAKIHEKQGNFDKALNAQLEALKISKRNPDTSEATLIGSLFAKVGNMTQAKLWLEASLKVTLPENVATRKEIYINLIDVYLERKDMKSLENTIIALDAIDKNIINEKHPTLKAKLAEFKHRLAEVEAQLDADKRRNEIEKEQLQAEAEKNGVKKENKTPEPSKTEISSKSDENKTERSKTENDVKKESENAQKTASDNKNANEKNPELEKQLNEIQKDNNAPSPSPKPPKKEESELEKLIRKTRQAIEKGDIKGALAQANLAISKNEQSPEAWRAMAEAFLANKLYNDAYLAANEAYLINSESLESALLLLETAKKDKSEKIFLKIAQSIWNKFNNSPDVTFYLAQAHEASKNEQEAKKFYKLSLEMGLENYERVKKAQDSVKNK